MPIDFSKISKEQLDQIIKEEALRRRAEMLSESKKKARIAHLVETKKSLESQLNTLSEDMDMEEGLFSKLMGGGGNGNNGARRQTIINLLGHPNRAMALLQYASPEQVQEFKSLMGDKAQTIDAIIAKRLGGKTLNDKDRTDKYINFFMKGGNLPKWDAQSNDYLDAGKVGTAAAHSFQREQKGQA